MYSFIKRCFDFICALLALVALSPIFLLTAIGILISDWGPIFYKANRIGKGNKPFKMYKFRSMKVLKAPKEGALALWQRISLICSVTRSGMRQLKCLWD